MADPFGADNPFAKSTASRSADADPFSSASDPFAAPARKQAQTAVMGMTHSQIQDPFAAPPPAPAPAPAAEAAAPEAAEAAAASQASSAAPRQAPRMGAEASTLTGPEIAVPSPTSGDDYDPFSAPASSPPISPGPSVGYRVGSPSPPASVASPVATKAAAAAEALAAAAQRSGQPGTLSTGTHWLSMAKDQWKEAVLAEHAKMCDLGREGLLALVREKAIAVAQRPDHKQTVPPDLLVDAKQTPEGLRRLLRHLRLSEHARPFFTHNRVEVMQATRHSGGGFAGAHWAYSFRVYTTLSLYQGQPRYDGLTSGKDFSFDRGMTIFNIERRFTHFEWLRKALILENPGCVVPPIPEKTVQSMKDKAKGKEGDFYRVGDLEESGKKKGTWQPDSQASCCNLCKKEFGLLRRRHHCRYCAMIFCDDCCPKGPTGSRKCRECASLKGIGAFLQDHPDVAYRMRYLTQFLVTCYSGPLSESVSLQFFVEAPVAVLESQMESRLKELQHKRDLVCERSLKDKIAGTTFWEKECTGKRRGDLTPRSLQRRDWGLSLLLKATEYDAVKKSLHKQLVDGLALKVDATPQLPEHFEKEQDLAAINASCRMLAEAVGEFQNRNKELLFNMSADIGYLADLLRSAVEALGRIEEYNTARRKTKSPTLAASLAEVVDTAMATVTGDISWLNGFHGACMRRFLQMTWRYESQRDPCLYEWESVLPTIARLGGE
eukprot:TRINITY_DN14795_c0_g1_i1.p1 TRINITY_DN14795_c0_g1~~TRINITY_DN14795_c0_g1_i1.p1  ORF type:complete len:736 (+),score=166.99 TRINITY_DN14795_c0_g1_i1:54-2210(+)